MKILTIILVLVTTILQAQAAPDPQPQGFLSFLFDGSPVPPTGRNLVEAASEGNLEGVKDLVERGADVNYNGGEVLGMAARNGHVEVVRYLLEAGANPDGSSDRPLKGGPLSQAAKRNHLEIMDLLIAAGATTKFEHDTVILGGPSENGHLEAVQKLLAAGADPNVDDAYALLLASMNGHVDVVKELIAAGADVNGGRGWVINNAAEAGHLEVVKILVESNVTQNYISSSLSTAASNNSFEVVKFLLEKGADPNYRGALKRAAQAGSVDVVRALLDAGANITYDDEHGFPLHFAAWKGNIDAVVLLAERGGDINKQMRTDAWWDFGAAEYSNYGKGWSVLHVMARFGYPSVGRMVELGADVNLKDANGRTPLHVAVHYIKLAVVEELLKHCCDLSLTDNGGKTARALAKNITLQSVSNETAQWQKLMDKLEEIYPEQLATLPNNDKATLDLPDQFLDLVKSNTTLNESLQGIDHTRADVQTAIFYLLQERDRQGLEGAFEDLYCKPTLSRTQKITLGTEYVSKCECVPGEGSIMTFTPLDEVNLCQAESTTKGSPTSEDVQTEGAKSN